RVITHAGQLPGELLRPGQIDEALQRAQPREISISPCLYTQFRVHP
ncbi:MAG: hypothetical protein H6Q32_866, partial [Bacteroidetes bacterium]|nr:hypothetical protein [Bacteroidota bacterium]